MWLAVCVLQPHIPGPAAHGVSGLALLLVGAISPFLPRSPFTQLDRYCKGLPLLTLLQSKRDRELRKEIICRSPASSPALLFKLAKGTFVSFSFSLPGSSNRGHRSGLILGLFRLNFVMIALESACDWADCCPGSRGGNVFLASVKPRSKGSHVVDAAHAPDPPDVPGPQQFLEPHT